MVVTVPSGECSIGYWSTSANPRSGYPIWTAGYTNDASDTFGWYYCGGTAAGTFGWRMNLYPNGTLVTIGDQVVSSDASLKTDFGKINYSVSDIAACRAVTFNWRDGRGRSAGSIAQDWKPLIPELVHGEEGNMTLAYGQIALINTIIEAREIDALKKRVAELEEEIKRLRS